MDSARRAARCVPWCEPETIAGMVVRGTGSSSPEVRCRNAGQVAQRVRADDAILACGREMRKRRKSTGNSGLTSRHAPVRSRCYVRIVPNGPIADRPPGFAPVIPLRGVHHESRRQEPGKQQSPALLRELQSKRRFVRRYAVSGNRSNMYSPGRPTGDAQFGRTPPQRRPSRRRQGAGDTVGRRPQLDRLRRHPPVRQQGRGRFAVPLRRVDKVAANVVRR